VSRVGDMNIGRKRGKMGRAAKEERVLIHLAKKRLGNGLLMQGGTLSNEGTDKKAVSRKT